MLEAMDIKKISIKKLPLKLFGSLNDGLRLCCIDLVKSHLLSYADILLLVTVIESIVNDYIDRKGGKIQEKPRESVNQTNATNNNNN